MTDNSIGTIEGIATFERVSVNPAGNYVRVIGEYDGDRTTYETHQDRVFIGGMSLDLIHDEFWLRPQDGDYLYVWATEDELRISEEKPNDLPDVTPREIVQMMAAQSVVLDNHGSLHEEYEEQIREFAEEYGIDHELLRE